MYIADWSSHLNTTNSRIVITPGICGGKPRIAGHRITVQNVVIWHERMGKSVDEIATEYRLSLSEVHSSLAFYFDHREEVDRSISEGEKIADSLRVSNPSKVGAKLRAMSDAG